jgi:hypothetical protein
VLHLLDGELCRDQDNGRQSRAGGHGSELATDGYLKPYASRFTLHALEPLSSTPESNRR